MLFLEVEASGTNRRKVNLELIDKVQIDDAAKRATLWSGGIIVIADSKIAYEFFHALPEQFKIQEAKE